MGELCGAPEDCVGCGLCAEDDCTCEHVAIRMECIKCGYPACEARYLDDGSDCGCTSCKEI